MDGVFNLRRSLRRLYPLTGSCDGGKGGALVPLSGTEVLMGFDYVLVNGRESGVYLQTALVELNTGNLLSLSQPVLFSIRLVTGQSYSFIFWAYKDGAPYTLDAANKKVTVDYSDATAETINVKFAAEPTDVLSKALLTTPLKENGVLNIEFANPCGSMMNKGMPHLVNC